MSSRLFVLCLSFVSFSAFAYSPKLEVLCQYLNGTGENRDQVNVSILANLQGPEKTSEIYYRTGGKEREYPSASISRTDSASERTYSEIARDVNLSLRVNHKPEASGIHLGFLSVELEGRIFQEQPVKCAVFR